MKINNYTYSSYFMTYEVVSMSLWSKCIMELPFILKVLSLYPFYSTLELTWMLIILIYDYLFYFKRHS